MIKKKHDTLWILGNGKWEDKEFISEAGKLSKVDSWIIGGGYYWDKKITDKWDTTIGDTLSPTYLFEIHTMHTRSDGYLEFLKDCPIPKIMQKEDCVLDAAEYPLDKIIDHFDSRYFMCSFAYMIALAMYLGYKEIHMYGVNMLMLDDLSQKYNCDYWLGKAEESGIKLQLSLYCDLLIMPKLYGYEADNSLAVMMARIMGDKETYIRKNLKLIGNEDLINTFETYTRDRVAFMEEIYKRHGINITGAKEGDEEDY